MKTAIALKKMFYSHKASHAFKLKNFSLPSSSTKTKDSKSLQGMGCSSLERTASKISWNFDSFNFIPFSLNLKNNDFRNSVALELKIT